MSKKQTSAQLIREGIKKGHTAEKILKNVTSKIPTANADNSHIVYYANELKRKGDIDEKLHTKYVKARGKPSNKAKVKAATSKIKKPKKRTKK